MRATNCSSRSRLTTTIGTRSWNALTYVVLDPGILEVDAGLGRLNA